MVRPVLVAITSGSRMRRRAVTIDGGLASAKRRTEACTLIHAFKSAVSAMRSPAPETWRLIGPIVPAQSSSSLRRNTIGTAATTKGKAIRPRRARRPGLMPRSAPANASSNQASSSARYEPGGSSATAVTKASVVITAARASRPTPRGSTPTTLCDSARGGRVQ
jgi:hypothetical protein